MLSYLSDGSARIVLQNHLRPRNMACMWSRLTWSANISKPVLHPTGIRITTGHLVTLLCPQIPVCFPFEVPLASFILCYFEFFPLFVFMLTRLVTYINHFIEFISIFTNSVSNQYVSMGRYMTRIRLYPWAMVEFWSKKFEKPTASDRQRQPEILSMYRE